MARKPRIHYFGAFYHAMLRGNAKQDIFFGDEDRSKFCLFLQEAAKQYDCQIHAFCLMHNHVHLAIQVSNIPLSKFMQSVSFRYAKWVNKRMNRVGHLFQGRFKAVLVDTDSYLTTLVRYIHLNPVRANLIPNLTAPWWSSHRTYLGHLAYPWVTTDFVLSHFNHSRVKAIKIYRNFMAAEIQEKNNTDLSIGAIDKQILGDEIFIEKASQAMHIDLPMKYTIGVQDVVNFVSTYFNITSKNLCEKNSPHKYAETRAIITWLCKELNIATLTEMATFFRRGVPTLTAKIKWMVNEKHTVLHGFLSDLKKRKTEA